MGAFVLLLLAVAVFAVNAANNSNPVVKAFTENQLVPDILPQAPDALLDVEYKKSGKVVSLGNEIARVDVREAPQVTFKADAKDFYTLQFVDPDAPSRTNATKRSVNHWLVVNIPASDVSKGQTLTEYLGSGPPKGSGLHRYIFLLYRQPGRLTFDEKLISSKELTGRPLHSAQKFAEKYKLELQAGNFYQAQYDDSVLELQKRLNIAPAPV
uniref:Phosphatidylethanolamine-binding protein n=1 Tax=Dendroctonus ponderosae TaxID=77166 RepID=J3JW85_DENPD|nr:unknown [Dendroctonus ponderosae]